MSCRTSSGTSRIGIADEDSTKEHSRSDVDLPGCTRGYDTSGTRLEGVTRVADRQDRVYAQLLGLR
jgi:hypothetical protein